MRNRSLVPKPWWQVGLTALPGLIFLLGQVSSRSKPLNTGLRFLAWAVMILLIISSVLLAATRLSTVSLAPPLPTANGLVDCGNGPGLVAGFHW
jgi:hypothetical protein